ncbi:MAG: hypothetical protein LBC63_03145 [Holophagales bacterium]|jgi:hypothetical protein|nr:hypothetical protein [Holophagales bacterium]
MSEEKIDRVLRLMFSEIKAPEGAKAKLRARLFENTALSDDEMEFVTAGAEPAKREIENNPFEPGKHDEKQEM